MDFNSFGLNADVLRGVVDAGYTEPTPIQRDAIPPAMAGKDLLACAMTGSGKTAAFVLPIIHRLQTGPRPRRATRCLILSPTRELAQQTVDNIAALGAHTSIRGAAVYGGVGMQPQEASFRKGTEIIVACPGRLLDHFQYGYAKLEDIEILVLDEADRMLDMGFLPDIRRVLAHLPKKPRQTLFFSATMPAEIVRLSRDLLRDPIAINIERKAAPAIGITHAAYPVPQDRKTALFMELLKRPEVRSVLAFTRTKHRANRLADFLEKHGISSARIHGNRSQAQRQLALDGFKANKFRVLVATDIAARGIDIDALSHVINFDVPGQSEDYIHRCGRTARAELTGDAITFVSPDEETDLRQIERAINAKVPRVTLPNFDYTARTQERFEVPIGERIAAIRSRRSEERTRAKEKLARKSGGGAGQAQPARSQGQGPQHSSRPAAGPRQGERSGPARTESAPPRAEKTEVLRSDSNGTVTFTSVSGGAMKWPSGGGGRGRGGPRRR